MMERTDIKRIYGKVKVNEYFVRHGLGLSVINLIEILFDRKL
jgi:hypothetical protein